VQEKPELFFPLLPKLSKDYKVVLLKNAFGDIELEGKHIILAYRIFIACQLKGRYSGQ
jgi:hypothetical protein